MAVELVGSVKLHIFKVWVPAPGDVPALKGNDLLHATTRDRSSALAALEKAPMGSYLEETLVHVIAAKVPNPALLEGVG